MLGVREILLTLELTLNSHDSTKHNLNKNTLGVRVSLSRNPLGCLEASKLLSVGTGLGDGKRP